MRALRLFQFVIVRMGFKFLERFDSATEDRAQALTAASPLYDEGSRLWQGGHAELLKDAHCHLKLDKQSGQCEKVADVAELRCSLEPGILTRVRGGDPPPQSHGSPASSRPPPRASRTVCQTKKRIDDDRVCWRWRLLTLNRGGSDVPG
jgi:hypothetical protein